MDYKSSEAINNSLLSLINPAQGGHPRKFVEQWKNPINREATGAQKLGTTIHSYFESPNDFSIITNRPTDKLAELVELAATTCMMNCISPRQEEMPKLLLEAAKTLDYGQNWKEHTLKDKFLKGGAYDYFRDLMDISLQGKVMLSAEMGNTVNNCVHSIKSNDAATILLEGANADVRDTYIEQEIYFEFEGEPCKAKLDRLVIDHSNKKLIVIDFKTTSKSVSKFQESFEEYHYYRQAAFYREAALAFCYQEFGYVYDVECYIIAVETTGDNLCEVFEVSFEWLGKGWKEAKELIERVKKHLAINNWNHPIEALDNNGIMKFEEPE